LTPFEGIFAATALFFTFAIFKLRFASFHHCTLTTLIVPFTFLRECFFDKKLFHLFGFNVFISKIRKKK
jgi:hypothetical protein